jgi:hypothetical protein
MQALPLKIRRQAWHTLHEAEWRRWMGAAIGAGSVSGRRRDPHRIAMANPGQVQPWAVSDPRSRLTPPRHSPRPSLLAPLQHVDSRPGRACGSFQIPRLTRTGQALLTRLHGFCWQSSKQCLGLTALVTNHECLRMLEMSK